MDVFDIETEDWSIFVCGGALIDGEYVESWNEDTFFASLMRRGAGRTLYAHNGGRFDFLWFLGHCQKRGISPNVALRGSSVMRVSVDDGPTLIDSLAFCPLKLADLSTMFGGQPKTDVGLPCSCAEPCGGYCSIRRDMPPAHRGILRKYLHQDCESLSRSLGHLFDFCRGHDIEIRQTIGASAWATAKKMLELPAAKWNRARYDLARRGYYGGRVEVYRPKAAAGFRYDIHSAYPAALSQSPIPLGKSPTYIKAPAKAYDQGRPGVFCAVVTVPDMLCPPLPWRPAKGGLAFPVGTFDGVWTRDELNHAENVGATIKRFRWGLVWPSEDRALAPFMRHYWNVRQAVGKSTPLGKWLKLFINSLTGKFAQHPEIEDVLLWPLNGFELALAYKNASDKDKANHWKPKDERLLLFAKSKIQFSSCCHVQWSATLTAQTRIELHRKLCDADPIYCDTDSVYSVSESHHNLGDDLGTWALEGRLENWQAIAPKAYRYIDPETGKRAVRCKGAPVKSWEDFDAYLSGGVPVARGVKTFKTAARLGELFAKRDDSRQFKGKRLADGTPVYGSRVLSGDVTRPPVGAL